MREIYLGRFMVQAMGLLAAALCAPAYVWAAAQLTDSHPVLVIPRVQRPPVLEDFLDMKPNRAMDGKLTKVEGFIQREPRDGEPSSQRTEVYLGYDDKNLYVIFVTFDSEPGKIRARRGPRENPGGDDAVSLTLDTFHDQRRAYTFFTNPLGIQWDGLITEGQGYDGSFDTLWHSKGKVTDRGYVVWMAIPFKSLRFPSTQHQTWGIMLGRVILRMNETAYWPRFSSRIEGRLNQAATLRGLGNVSPGRNIQLIPYGFLRSFRALDSRDPNQPRFVTDRADIGVGLDAKFVIKDSFALDLALNPDFSQVESDQPQVEVNRRFEVFFPEKRPFFLENAGFFETPINLFFTRRIADPQLGIRLTGKRGPYAIGALLADDEAPGKIDPSDDPRFGKRARFAIVRINRDIFKQSTLGLIYTAREFAGSFNRVGGLDGRFKLSKNWVARFQGVASSTEKSDGTHLAGPAYDAQLRRAGRQFNYALDYRDRSPGFRTLAGFVPRSDIRRVEQSVRYRFRPEGKYLISWGPRVSSRAVWDHSGTRLDLVQNSSLNWELVGRTEFRLFHHWHPETLRPQDFEVLPENRDFSHQRTTFSFETSTLAPITFEGSYSQGTLVNFVPPEGQEPILANLTSSDLGLTLRPFTPLRIDNTYILERLTSRAQDASIFNNHIIRSKWNWQFNRELSLRVILQYDTVLANPELTALQITKNFNADFLLTYLVNPWTALYISYNGNAQNVDLLPTSNGSDTGRFINDARQFFIKFSYLVRF